MRGISVDDDLFRDVEPLIDQSRARAAGGQVEAAQRALIAILQNQPSHLRALDTLGTLLAETGAIAAACRVFSEAIARHPDDPHGYVGLGGLQLRANDHAAARANFEAALQRDPDQAQAHQGMGAVLADSGDAAAAAAHFRKGFRDHAVSRRPYRGAGESVRLLQLVAAGAGNVPTARIFDDRVFETTVVVADCVDPAAPLPSHQLVFNAIGDADRCGDALAAAEALLQQTSAPVINPPAAVRLTGRVDTARRLRGIPGVVTPRTVALPRAVLAGVDAAATLAREGFDFPLLLRAAGCHTGRHFERIAAAQDLAAAVARLPGETLLVIAFHDVRGQDGCARKYRVMTIGGELYPLHLAIAPQWKVHYVTADMAERSDHRAEEAAFLGDMAEVLGKKAMRALRDIAATLGLDYCGIDFALGANGEVVVFEANATMVINPPGPELRWHYRRAPIARAMEAAATMLLQRCPMAPGTTCLP